MQPYTAPYQFREFPKIPRYKREVCVTEKIDGTNAAVVWHPISYETEAVCTLAVRELFDSQGVSLGTHALHAQSRSRILVPEITRKGGDNFGFAQWVSDNATALQKLGPGVHYGEWWGSGIQRGYGQPAGVRHFSLFDVHRWPEPPSCCRVVPILGWCKPEEIDFLVEELRESGSRAAQGYMNPEGVIVYHSQSKQRYKILLENDEVPKSVTAAQIESLESQAKRAFK